MGERSYAKRNAPASPAVRSTSVSVASETVRPPEIGVQLATAERFGHRYGEGMAPIQRQNGLRRRRGFQHEEEALPPRQEAPRVRANRPPPNPNPSSVTDRLRAGVGTANTVVGAVNTLTGGGNAVTQALGAITGAISGTAQTHTSGQAAADASARGEASGTRRTVQTVAGGIGTGAAALGALLPVTAPVAGPVAAIAGGVSALAGAPDTVQQAQQQIGGAPGLLARGAQAGISLLPDRLQRPATRLVKRGFGEQE